MAAHPKLRHRWKYKESSTLCERCELPRETWAENQISCPGWKNRKKSRRKVSSG